MEKRVRVAIAGLAPGEQLLDRAAAHYLTRVRRLRPGDRFIAFDPEQRIEALAVLLDNGSKSARCNVHAVEAATVVAERRVFLIQAIGKGDKPDRVIRDATALAVTTIVLCQTERSVVKVFENSTRERRWRAIALDAARQCGRGDAPAVIGPTGLSGALLLSGLPPFRAVLDSESPAPLVSVLEQTPTARESAAFLIGPEGGLSKHELALADQAGFVRCSLGPFTLRTELAASAVLSTYSNWALSKATG